MYELSKSSMKSEILHMFLHNKQLYFSLEIDNILLLIFEFLCFDPIFISSDPINLTR